MQGKIQLRPSAKTNSSNSPTHSAKKARRNLREKPFHEFYNNRLNKMTNIFSQQGYNLEQLVTEDEILQTLDSLGKEPYNRELAAQLFEKIPSEGSVKPPEKRKFILQNFVDTHIKAEYFLLLHAEDIEDELEDVYSKVAIAKDELQGALHQPEEPIRTDSLQIDVLEVICEDEEYEADIGAVFSVILVVSDYKYETQEVTIETPVFNPQFNWNFHFRLKDPNETVRVLLRDQNRHGRDETYSDLKGAFDLKNFIEQTSNEVDLTLYNHDNQPTRFKVHMLIKWPPSKVEQCENKITEFQAVEQKLNEEKTYIEASIRKLVHPFAHASAALKAKRLTTGVKSESNIIMARQFSSDLVGDNTGTMRPIDMFRGTAGPQDLNKASQNPGITTITERSHSGQSSGRVSAQLNSPPENINLSESLNSKVGQRPYDNIGINNPSETTKKSMPYDLGDNTNNINKNKLEATRHSTEPAGSKQGIFTRPEYPSQMPMPGGYSKSSMQSNQPNEFVHPSMPQTMPGGYSRGSMQSNQPNEFGQTSVPQTTGYTGMQMPGGNSRSSTQSNYEQRKQTGDFVNPAVPQPNSRTSMQSNYEAGKQTGSFAHPKMPQMTYASKPGSMGNNTYMPGETASETTIRRTKQNNYV